MGKIVASPLKASPELGLSRIRQLYKRAGLGQCSFGAPAFRRQPGFKRTPVTSDTGKPVCTCFSVSETEPTPVAELIATLLNGVPRILAIADLLDTLLYHMHEWDGDFEEYRDFIDKLTADVTIPWGICGGCVDAGDKLDELLEAIQPIDAAYNAALDDAATAMNCGCDHPTNHDDCHWEISIKDLRMLRWAYRNAIGVSKCENPPSA